MKKIILFALFFSIVLMYSCSDSTKDKAIFYSSNRIILIRSNPSQIDTIKPPYTYDNLDSFNISNEDVFKAKRTHTYISENVDSLSTCITVLIFLSIILLFLLIAAVAE